MSKNLENKTENTVSAYKTTKTHSDKTGKNDTNCSSLITSNNWQFIIYGKRVWQTFEFHLSTGKTEITSMNPEF